MTFSSQAQALTVAADPCVGVSGRCQPTQLLKQAHHIFPRESGATTAFDTTKSASHSLGCSPCSPCRLCDVQCPIPAVRAHGSYTVIISAVQCRVSCVQPSPITLMGGERLHHPQGEKKVIKTSIIWSSRRGSGVNEPDEYP